MDIIEVAKYFYTFAMGFIMGMLYVAIRDIERSRRGKKW